MSVAVSVTAGSFLSTPSARRATPVFGWYPVPISISIHALREEGDQKPDQAEGEAEIFLSTPSARRATRPCGQLSLFNVISIHALREEGDQGQGWRGCEIPISIHALREEGDEQVQRYIDVGKKFLSTPSARRATQAIVVPSLDLVISIHALREEGDSPGT